MLTAALQSVIKDSRRIPVGVKLIVFVLFVRMLGWGLVDPYYSMYIQQFTESYTTIGLFAGMMSVIQLIVILPLIRLADKVKDARIIEVAIELDDSAPAASLTNLQVDVLIQP